MLAALNLVGYIATVIVNALANSLPINGKLTGELSDAYPNLFVPSGLTFSIWGVIYLLLAIFFFLQFYFALRGAPDKTWATGRLGWVFFGASIANIGWILAWHYQVVWLSLVLMLAILACLLSGYLRLRIGEPDTPVLDKYFTFPAFSVYLGWITIATIANVTAVLVYAGFSNLWPGEQFWTVLVILVGVVITLLMLWRKRDNYYAFVVDWAILGIYLKRQSLPDVPAQAVIIACITGMAVISAAIVFQTARRRVYQTYAPGGSASKPVNRLKG